MLNNGWEYFIGDMIFIIIVLIVLITIKHAIRDYVEEKKKREGKNETKTE